MAETTVSGATTSGIKSLTPQEHQSALNALSKLSTSSGATHGIASSLGATLKSATLSGGSVHDGTKSTSTFAGGAQAASGPITSVGSDTVVAGSGFSAKTETFGSGHTLSVGSDTINVAGTTAAVVKHEPLAAKASGQTITLSDKTTITLTGVSAHDVAKPH